MYVCGVQAAFKTPAPTPSSSPVTTAAEPPAPDLQQAMAKQFSQQSGMNLDWSIKSVHTCFVDESNIEPKL